MLLFFCPYVVSSDFEQIEPISVLVNIDETQEVTFFISNDEVALEYNDTVILIFEPVADLVRFLEEHDEYVRETTIVQIIDNDGTVYCYMP